MIRIPARAWAFLAAAALTLTGAATLAATPATAAPRDLGGVEWSLTTGSAQSLLKIYSEGPCPAESKFVKATMFGHGMPARGQTIVSPSELLIARDKSMGLSVSQAFQIYGEENNTALAGDYEVVIQCTDRFGMKSLGDFTTTVTWKTPGNKVANLEKATFTARNTAAVDQADVFVPDGDRFAQSLSEPEEAASPAATPKPKPTPNATGSAAPSPLPTVTASPGASASGGVVAGDVPAPSEGASTTGTQLVWIGLAAVLLIVAGLIWFRPWRRSPS